LIACFFSSKGDCCVEKPCAEQQKSSANGPVSRNLMSHELRSTLSTAPNYQNFFFFLLKPSYKRMFSYPDRKQTDFKVTDFIRKSLFDLLTLAMAITYAKRVLGLSSGLGSRTPSTDKHVTSNTRRNQQQYE
jgi:hypothetical protein